MRIEATSAAESRNESALRTNATRGPKAPLATPPSTAPASITEPPTAPLSALAASRFSGSTSAGITAERGGALRMPDSTSSRLPA